MRSRGGERDATAAFAATDPRGSPVGCSLIPGSIDRARGCVSTIPRAFPHGKFLLLVLQSQPAPVPVHDFGLKRETALCREGVTASACHPPPSPSGLRDDATRSSASARQPCSPARWLKVSAPPPPEGARPPPGRAPAGERGEGGGPRAVESRTPAGSQGRVDVGVR